MNGHKTAVVSRKPTFCVDDKHDSKITCDTKSLYKTYPEIGVTRQPTAPLNPYITKVHGSVFYHPSHSTSSNPCDLDEFHVNTQTEPNSFTPKQKSPTIAAAPPAQNYVLHQAISPGLYTKNSPLLEPPAPNQASHCKANQATIINRNIDIQSTAQPRVHNPVFIAPAYSPSLEPPVFDGNPANYCNFVDAFNALIAYSIYEPKRKLFFLLQYTTSHAHALVKGCQHMPNDLGYVQARELLQKTFGQKIQIAKACVDSVTQGPVLHQK